MTFTGKMTLWLGKLEVQLLQLGRGHTKGDTVVWLPQERTLLSGDLVEFDATPYAGDAYFKDWPRRSTTWRRSSPRRWCPAAAPRSPRRRASPRASPARATSSPSCTRALRRRAKAGKDLNAVYKDTFAKLKPKYGHWVIFDHCMPFDVTRCYDEATQYPDPRIWTAERDLAMWKALES